MWKTSVPYVRSTRATFEEDTPAVVIIDNFKGQITSSVTYLLELNNIHVCLLLPHTTDLLQPMDLSVNKPAKDFPQKAVRRLVHAASDRAAGRKGF